MAIKTEIRVKNNRPGVLFIADAKLRLRSGEVAVVANLSRQMQKCLDRGYISIIEGKDTPVKPKKREQESPKPLGSSNEVPQKEGSVLNKLAEKLKKA